MADAHEPRADRFMLDTMRLAFALDAVSTRDWPDGIAQAIRQGYLMFAELLLRRMSVALNPEDETLMDWVLEAIRARLQSLERFHRCTLPN